MRRHLSRCTRGSNRYRRVGQGLANLHRRIRNQRLDALHRATVSMGIEEAGAHGHRKAPDPRHDARGRSSGQGVGGHGTRVRQIRYKARWRGRTLTEASRELARALLCSRCGQVEEGMKDLAHSTFACGNYGCEVSRETMRLATRYGTARHAGTGGARPPETQTGRIEPRGLRLLGLVAEA